MANRDIVAIGTSAGGFEALLFLANRFPQSFPAAVCCGNRGIGVILTRTLGDGASGLWAVNQTGGMTVVQDPKDAAFPEMPQTTLKRMEPDMSHD